MCNMKLEDVLYCKSWRSDRMSQCVSHRHMLELFSEHSESNVDDC